MPRATDFVGCLQTNQDRASVNHNAAFNLAASWTIEGWLYNFAARADRSNYCNVLTKGDTNTAFQLQLDADSSPKPLLFRRKVSSASQDVATPGGALRDEWFHFAVRGNGTVMQMLINGAQVASTAAAGTTDTNTGPLRVGQSEALAANSWNGLVYDLRLWSTFRSDGEIALNMDQQVGADATGLVANWMFDEGIGDVVGDRTVNARDMALRVGHSWSSNRGRPY
jgi:hypothetical protein